MKINSVKINGFGNLKDKEINLEDGINIIKGKNESGKSTLLKFIPAMFYGLAKTKNGKDISDLEKYRPWVLEDFSGKIIYTLDNSEKYEVYRDFNKKVCKVYNANGEDVTQNYDMDKLKQSQFFVEQTGISEDVLMKTAVSEQVEVRLNAEDRNVIIQKISNVISTGNDNISYKKAVSKLKEKQNEEVGTDRTIGRPINIIRNELKKQEEKENEIRSNMQQVDNYEAEKSTLNRRLDETNTEIQLLSEVKRVQENTYLEKEKININKGIIEEYNEKILELKHKENDIKTENVINKDKKMLVGFILTIAVAFSLGIFMQNWFLSAPFLGLSLIFLLLQIKKNSKNKKVENTVKNNVLGIRKEIEILEKSLAEKQAEILKQERDLNIKIDENNMNLKSKYTSVNPLRISEIFKCSIDDINNEIKKSEGKINDIKLELSRKEILYNNLLECKEELLKTEEKIQNLRQHEKEIMSLNRSIEIAKIALEEAYEKMKENITPKFISNLSSMVSKVSNSKYTNVKFNDKEGVTVELSSGEYVKADKLSIGTIDQIYMSLRLAALGEISKEQMPIILDESFAYYDNERLDGALAYLDNMYSNSQIIIYTCTDREIEMLNDKKIRYNLVEI